ncbi:hypothetical protein BGZ79_000543, partial [Entomortierella chlamydospora]
MNNNEDNRIEADEEDYDENDGEYQYEEAMEDDDDDEDEAEFHIEVELEGSEDDDNDEDDNENTLEPTSIDLAALFAQAGGPARIQLLQLMQTLYGGQQRDDDDDDDDNDNDDYGYGLYGYRNYRRRPRSPSPIPEPDREKGNELLNSGEFGRVDSAYVPSKENKKNLARKLWMRQVKPRSVNPLALGETILPDNPGKVIDRYSNAAYSGQYSADGSLFATSDRDWKLRIYKTAGNRLIRERVIDGVVGRWTITDHNLSLDSHWLIYSSITPIVYLTRTAADAPDEHHPLDFSSHDEDHALWSVRFSGDGREIVAGGKDRIYGKDRRSMSAGRHSVPSGILVGHAEGITYVTSKGDNRYLASNGKDQKMLLWDLRMMHSKKDFESLPRPRMTNFDYRSNEYHGSKSAKVAGDCSVMTFQGHKVLRTLIRCHFSPAHTTGQRYLYTGSADGKVAIYRLDGTLVRTLDTSAPFARTRNGGSEYTARDCQAEITPMMVPDPTCPNCQGEFVEKIESDNDPRTFIQPDTHHESGEDGQQDASFGEPMNLDDLLRVFQMAMQQQQQRQGQTFGGGTSFIFSSGPMGTTFSHRSGAPSSEQPQTTEPHTDTTTENTARDDQQQQPQGPSSFFSGLSG